MYVIVFLEFSIYCGQFAVAVKKRLIVDIWQNEKKKLILHLFPQKSLDINDY